MKETIHLHKSQFSEKQGKVTLMGVGLDTFQKKERERELSKRLNILYTKNYQLRLIMQTNTYSLGQVVWC